MKLDALSSLLGAACLGAALFTMSALQAPAGSTPTTAPWGWPALTITGPVQIDGIPTAQQMTRIVEGTPFPVPPGKLLVCTGLGSNVPGTNDELRDLFVAFDGEDVLSARTLQQSTYPSITGGGPSIASIPPGLVAPEGTVVEVSDNVGTAILLGYLADA
ncbi:MAG: hypothetical protein AAF682_28970 [Planctomycetota bacterium]